jgi:hypothetical protein
MRLNSYPTVIGFANINAGTSLSNSVSPTFQKILTLIRCRHLCCSKGVKRRRKTEKSSTNQQVLTDNVHSQLRALEEKSRSQPKISSTFDSIPSRVTHIASPVDGTEIEVIDLAYEQDEPGLTRYIDKRVGLENHSMIVSSTILLTGASRSLHSKRPLFDLSPINEVTHFQNGNKELLPANQPLCLETYSEEDLDSDDLIKIQAVIEDVKDTSEPDPQRFIYQYTNGLVCAANPLYMNQ